MVFISTTRFNLKFVRQRDCQKLTVGKNNEISRPRKYCFREPVLIHMTRNATACSSVRGIIHARPPELFIIGIGRAISEAIRTKRAFFLPVDHTPRNPERSRRCQDELDTRVEPCARLVGSINRVVRYISHPAVRSARIPTLYLRGVAPPRLAGQGAEETEGPRGGEGE